MLNIPRHCAGGKLDLRDEPQGDCGLCGGEKYG